MIEPNKRRTKPLKIRQIIVLILLVISIIGISGCKKDEETIYNRNIVVDNTVLPFYESSWTYNAEPEEQIRTKLSTILNETLANLPGSSEYIIVNHDGEDLTDEFLIEKSPSHNEMKDMIKEIKENGYLVVNKEKYRVTTIEKEINALYDGERTVWQGTLEKILEDNRESYENKDYEAINLYLRKNNLKVYDKWDATN